MTVIAGIKSGLIGQMTLDYLTLQEIVTDQLVVVFQSFNSDQEATFCSDTNRWSDLRHE